MSDIQRYSVFGKRNDPDSGTMVLYADHLAVVAKMQGEIDTLRHNSCPVCCGKPISGKPCVCEGSGDAVMAYGGIANILAQTELENERLKQQLEEAREPRRIALLDSAGSVLANALQIASRTAPVPVETGGCAPPVYAEQPRGADLSLMQPAETAAWLGTSDGRAWIRTSDARPVVCPECGEDNTVCAGADGAE